MDIEELRETFEFFDDWEDKYRFVIDLGKELEDLPQEDKVDANLIRGCQSQVWLTFHLEDDNVHLHMDSDAYIVRGLISIVLTALNHKKPAEILAFDIEALFAELELLAHLSVTRGNGLRAMIQRIHDICRAHVSGA